MKKKVAVIGMGYVGLPLAALCAKNGYSVMGLDNNTTIIDTLKKGKSHIRDETVERLLDEAQKSGNLFPTSFADDISECSIYIICVPTPVDHNHEPDTSPIENAITTIAPHLNKGDLVILESTVFPGTCEQLLIPALENKSKMEAGVDFQVAHCPERVNPGDPFWTSENIPRVVGATSEVGVNEAAEFYASILGGEIYDVRSIKYGLRPKFSVDDEGALKVAQVSLGSVTKMRSIKDAEAVKAMENTVRDVNIAFVNELAKISDVLNLDVVDIIDGMSTKPFGKGPFYPGVGVGGHCIAVDPEWLKAASKRAGYMPEIIDLARNTNNGMPEYTVSILQDLLNERGYPLKDTPIAVLGVAYKKNVDDERESPFFNIKELLEKKGAALRIYDSWISSSNTVDTLQDAITGAKAILIVTEHDDMIAELKAVDMEALGIEVVIDGRNCLEALKMASTNILYRGIGRSTL
jgi:UDP-N-acetyl-D-glucosamine dehydrogenase